MSAPVEQFEFTADSRAKADAFIAKYPEGRQQSAVMPLLDIAQRQNGGWLSQASLEYVADYLSIPSIRVYEVATFYAMYNLKPVGKHHLQLCRTTPCWLRGADDISDAIKGHLNVETGGTTEDGEFTLSEVECLGACVNAPMVQINDDFYEDLTPENITKILDALKNGETPTVGSQTGRATSAPQSGPKTLAKMGSD